SNVTKSASKTTRRGGCRALSLVLVASLTMTLCTIGGVASGYLFYELIEIPYFYELYRTLVHPLEASGLLPAVGPRFEDVPGEQAAELSVQGNPRVNVLLVGLDQRWEVQHRSFRTDTMMIASLHADTNEALLFSIPRDLYVEVPGHGKRRINIAHVLGETQNYPGGGPALLMDTIQQDFGIPLHGYVMIDFQGFRETVDLLGGVDIYVDKEIWDNHYPDDRGGEITIHIPAGQQHMDSETLLVYCRTRHGSDDFDRMTRQQKALVALGKKALSLQMLPRLPELLQTMSHTFYTDLSLTTLIQLANMASQVDPDNIRSVVIDRSYLDPSQRQPGDEPSLLYPDWDRVHALVDEAFYD
ncbi:MAG TPA: LCP family protein, partial [Anaerolineae bacterium]|nr:LCP family protein [Anaerolineae bacterium]